MTTPQIVAQIYRDVLGREPDIGGLRNWVGSGLSPDAIADAIRNSPEGLAYQKRRNYMILAAVAAAAFFLLRRR